MEQNQENEGLIESQLLFYKSLMRNNVDIQKINHYLEILNTTTENNVKLDNPVDEGIRTAFRLVAESNMDPWSIDIHEFVKLYKSRVKGSKFDIIVAGKLLVLAWDIVRLQSEATKEESERNGFCSEWDYTFDFELMYEKEDVPIPDIELDESAPHEFTRPATMLEILDIMEEVGTDFENDREREEYRLELKAKKKEIKFNHKMGSEINDSDVEKVWERIQKIGPGEFSIRELYTDSLKDNVITFLAVLHLVYRNELEIRQDDLLNDDIKISIIVGEAAEKPVLNQEIEVA